MTTNTTTPSREEMLQAIYEKIADKTLSFGCEIQCKNYTMQIQKKYGCYIYDGTIFENDGDDIYDKEIEEYKIIGHPVMIGDVVDYCEQHGLEGDIEKLYGVEYMPIGKINLPTNIFTLWEEKRKPITEQSDECVKFIYSLISE